MRSQYHRLQGLPPDSPPAMEGQERVAMERPASAEAHRETTLATKPVTCPNFVKNILSYLILF